MKKLASLLWLGMLCSTAAFAASEQEPITVHMDAYQIISTKDAEKRIEAKKVKPGDVLEYVATYHNTTKHSIAHIKATLPIPQGTVFVANSARPRHATASLDGKVFQVMPLKHRVKQKDGSWKEELVPLDAYRFLRWDLKVLDKGSEQKVSARVRLIPLNR